MINFKEGRLVGYPKCLPAVSFFPDYSHVIMMGSGRSLYIYNVNTGERVNKIRIDDITFGMCYCIRVEEIDGHTVIVCFGDRRVVIFNAHNAQEVNRLMLGDHIFGERSPDALNGRNGKICKVTIDGQQKLCFVSSRYYPNYPDNIVMVHDLLQRPTQPTVQPPMFTLIQEGPYALEAAVFLEINWKNLGEVPYLITADSNWIVSLWDLRSRQRQEFFSVSSGVSEFMHVSIGQKAYLVISYINHEYDIYDVALGTLKHTIKSEKILSNIIQTIFTATGQKTVLIIKRRDDVVEVWDLESALLLKRLKEGKNPLEDGLWGPFPEEHPSAVVVYIAGRSYIVVGHEKRLLSIWETLTWRCVNRVKLAGLAMTLKCYENYLIIALDSGHWAKIKLDQSTPARTSTEVLSLQTLAMRRSAQYIPSQQARVALPERLFLETYGSCCEFCQKHVLLCQCSSYRVTNGDFVAKRSK